MAVAHDTVAFHKANLFRAANHADVARPGLRIYILYTVFKEVRSKCGNRFRAIPLSPYGAFTDVNTDCRTLRKTILRPPLPFQGIVKSIGIDSAKVMAVGGGNFGILKLWESSQIPAAQICIQIR